MEKAVLTGQGERSDAGPVSATAATAAADSTAGTAAADPTGATAPANPAVVTASANSAAATAAADSTADSAAPAIPDDTGEVAVSPAAPGAEVRTQARAPRWANLPYAIVLAAIAGGLSWVALGGLRHVQAGMITVASALLVAAVLRLALPERAAGLLMSRRRVLDALVLACLGACIMATVLVLPSP